LIFLIEAVGPGRLEYLDLIHVALTDAGAAWLAKLPQLAHVTHLNLSGNRLTAQGLDTLLRSRHLSRLRPLNLHRGTPEPYETAVDAGQYALGDAGLRVLAESEVFRRLETLTLQAQKIGADGVRALEGKGHHLKRLNLAFNPLGAAGVGTLARGAFVPGLC